MSFNLSGLSVYTDQLSTDLVTRAILKPQSVSYLTVRPGLVTGTTAINILGGVVDVTDLSCGFGAAQVGSNTTAFTQTDLCVKGYQVKEELCPDTLREYWLSSQMSPSAYQETVPFETAIADYKVRQIGKFIEESIWNGDGTSGSCVVGLLDQISIANGAVDGSAYAGAWTASNSFANVWGMIDLLSNELKQEDDLVMYLSMSQYSKVVQGLMNQGNAIIAQYPNLSNGTGGVAQAFQFPGTNVTIFGAPGISTDQVIVGPKKYAFMGTGLIDDQDNFRFFYDSSVDVVKFMSKFRFGTAALSNQFVSNV
jgi:hypothetical protein